MPKQDLEPALVQAYADTFVSRFDLYPVQRPDSGRYVAVKKRLSLDLVADHLKGTITLGAYALDQDSQAKWLCFDADDREQWLRLWRMAQQLEKQGVTAYPEASRRGGHLWLFLSPMAGADARQLGLQLQAEYDLLDLEMFPKQDQLTTGPGSLVRLPLGIHRKDRRRHYFLSLDGQPLAPTIRAQIEVLTQPQRIPPLFVADLLSRAPEPRGVNPTRAFEPPDEYDLPDMDLPLSERLKASISVYDFVSQYVELDAQGRGLCPFHDDHQPSFSVDPQGNYWHCFSGCGGGSIVDFWLKWRETHGQPPDFVETLKDLANMLLPRSD